jgi:hypothetical protein
MRRSVSVCVCRDAAGYYVCACRPLRTTRCCTPLLPVRLPAGVVEYSTQEDLDRAIEKLDRSLFK